MKQQQFFPDTKLLPTFYNKGVGAGWAIANPDLVGPKGIEYCIIVGRMFPFYCLPTRYLFVCNRGDTVQYHGGLRSRELGQAPMLQVFLTPKQALSSHPRQQMV